MDFGGSDCGGGVQAVEFMEQKRDLATDFFCLI
jgi:hypothetical protein